MSISLPDEFTVSGVLAEISDLDDAILNSALHKPKLLTDLSHWLLWTLICLSRHVDRQKWVGHVVETHLRGDLHSLGSEGAFAHPHELPQSGKIPEIPGWSYYFHGHGCCMTNDLTGEEIDVDFDSGGESTRIDPYFYSSFLDSLKHPKFPEWVIKKARPLRDYWHQDLQELEQLECWHDREVTEAGLRVPKALAPVLDQLCQAQDRDQKLVMIYLCLHLGDYVLADSFANSSPLSAELVQDIKNRAHSVKKERAERLSSVVSLPNQRYGISLQALAELGPEYSKKETLDSLFYSPVDGNAITALEILNLWQQDDLDSILEALIEARAAEAHSSADYGDQQPRESQLTRSVRLILLRQRRRIKPRLKEITTKLLKAVTKAGQGEAALLLYLIDEQEGLKAFKRAFSSNIPHVHCEIAAACVVIGGQPMKQLLIDAIRSAPIEQQHAAASALSKFPDSREIPELSNWIRANDGIDDPVGSETQIRDRTIETFSMSDMAHAHMRSQIEWAIKSFDDLAPLICDW